MFRERKFLKECISVLIICHIKLCQLCVCLKLYWSAYLVLCSGFVAKLSYILAEPESCLYFFHNLFVLQFLTKVFFSRSLATCDYLFHIHFAFVSRHAYHSRFIVCVLVHYLTNKEFFVFKEILDDNLVLCQTYSLLT